MNTLLRILNSFLLAGMLAVLILIFLRIQEPISVQEPVAVTIDNEVKIDNDEPLTVKTDYFKPLEVEISNTPLEVEISR